MTEQFNERLKEALFARGFNAAELARIIGVSNGYMSNLLSGYIARPHKHLISIAEALRVRPEWLLNGYGDPNLDDNKHLVEVPLYKFVHNDQKKRYIKIIQLPEIALLPHSDGLYGVQIPPNEIFANSTLAVINEKLKGSRLFLLRCGGALTISMRIDDITSIRWIHHTPQTPDMNNCAVLGRILWLFLIILNKGVGEMILEKITNNNISYRVKKGGHIFRDSADSLVRNHLIDFFRPRSPYYSGLLLLEPAGFKPLQRVHHFHCAAYPVRVVAAYRHSSFAQYHFGV